MVSILFVAAAFIWVLSRMKLWKRVFNVRREMRSAIRRRAFWRYYVSIRIRELLGVIGFILAAVATILSEEFGYVFLHRWSIIILYTLYACIALYVVYLIVDFMRLRKRWKRLMVWRTAHPLYKARRERP